MVLQFVAGAQRYVLMKVLALNIICRGARRTCWTVIFALKRLWGDGVRQTWAAGLQIEQWSVAGQDETNDTNNTAATSCLPGWEDGWTHSGLTPQGVACVYPCCMPEKETAEANIALVSVCERVCSSNFFCFLLIIADFNKVIAQTQLFWLLVSKMWMMK